MSLSSLVRVVLVVGVVVSGGGSEEPGHGGGQKVRVSGGYVVSSITVGSVMGNGGPIILGIGYMIVELAVTVSSNQEITEVVTGGMLIVVVTTVIW